jgi:hypothetical protein
MKIFNYNHPFLIGFIVKIKSGTRSYSSVFYLTEDFFWRGLSPLSKSDPEPNWLSLFPAKILSFPLTFLF